MPIYQRKDRHESWYVDFRADGRRIRRRSPIQTPEGAAEFELSLRRQLEAACEPCDILPLASSATFAAFAERWMTDYVAVANRASTAREKRYALNRRLLPAFGHLPLSHITTNIIDARVAEWMREGLGVKRINNVLTVLRRALRCAEEWGLLDRVPLVRHHRYFPPVPRYLTRVESDRLLQVMEPGFWRTLVLFMLRTGVRFGEASALRWEDLDLDSDQPFVAIRRAISGGEVADPKTAGSRRTIALVPELVIALRVLHHQRPTTEWVFTAPSGRFYRPDNCASVLKRACRRAGVPVVTWHKLRHSCATQLLASGVPLAAIKELLGHTSIEVTTMYAHVAPNLMWDYMHVLSSSNDTLRTRACQ